MTLHSGKCVGGPFHGRPLHHGTGRMMIAIYASNPTKVVTRAPGAPEEHGIVNGQYAFDPNQGIWIWYPPGSSPQF